MSVFYGSLQGCRGEATRCGSKDSGIRASAQSYDGSIITKLSHDENGKLLVKVGTNNKSSCECDYETPVFNGTIDEFKELLVLARMIKEKKASITIHRKKSNHQLKLERLLGENYDR